MRNFTRFILTLTFSFCLALASNGQGYRSLDGYNNNLIHNDWGSAGANQLSIGTVGFADGVSDPTGPTWPNPRYISNMLFAQNTLMNDPRGLSAYCWGFGQFIDHNITLVKDNPDEVMPISVPMGDPFFDPLYTGSEAIPMHRSDSDPLTGTGPDNPRQFVNSTTSFIDGSGVYGNSEERGAWLRTFTGGKLKVSAGNLLPWNTLTGEYDGDIDVNAPEMAMPMPFVQKWFVAGDVRANENPFLTALHTLFVREHNRLCDELAVDNPDWTDEQLYQHARKLVGAEIQAIVYEEWLPMMGMEIPPYNGYDLFVNPGISNMFSAAAYRYGHTTINSLLVRMDNNGNYLPEGDILLRDAFFNPDATLEVGGIEPYLIGMATLQEQDFDCKVIDDLRNFLFGAPGAGGLDLAAININRGRDRGLADYNTVRADFGLEKWTSFDQVSADPLMNQSLQFVYGDIDKVDAWVGMLAENHMPDALFGETAMTIIKQQFMALRDGDRFYYENDVLISPEEKEWAKQTKLADVIRRNSGITIIQDEIFKAEQLVTSTTEKAGVQEMEIALYPNPVAETVYLRIPSSYPQKAGLQVSDAQGRVVMEKEIQLMPGNTTLSMGLPENWASGIYYLTVRANGLAGHQRFFKE